MPKTKINQGFTLIELIVVIAIIGILATAVLTGTDFLDQRLQAEDLNQFNRARQLYQAIEQLCLTDTSFTFCNHNTSYLDSTLWIKTLANKGLIKTDFTVQTGESYFYRNFTDSGPNVAFQVKSKRFLSNAGTNVHCKLQQPGSTVTHWFYPGCGQLR